MDIQKLFGLAQEKINQADFEGAADCCSKILRDAPDHPGALQILALAKYHAGEAGDALALLERATRVSPQSAAVFNDYGSLLLLTGRTHEAVEALERAIALQPGFIEALVNIGNALHRLGRSREAERRYREALEFDPQNARGQASLGTLLRTIGRPDEASTCLNLALEQAPQDARIHDYLGAAYRDLEQLDKARMSFEKALQLDSDLAEARINLAGLHMSSGDYPLAISLLEGVNTSNAQALLVESLLRSGQYSDCMEQISAIAKSDRVNLDVASISAYVAQQLERVDPYPFCPDPLSFVKVFESTENIVDGSDFLSELIEVAKARESVWEPRGISTRKGFQTAPDLFDEPTVALQGLQDLLMQRVEEYRRDFDAFDIPFIRDWPKEIVLQGWFVRLVKDGYQEIHNHPYGWLSGVIYLSVPATAPKPEGAIEFTLRKANYPAIAAEPPTRIHMPEAGDIAMFPASLFHRTIPFSSLEERLCIAFDVKPEQS